MARNFLWGQAAVALGLSFFVGQALAQDAESTAAASGETQTAEVDGAAEAPAPRPRRRILDEVIVTV